MADADPPAQVQPITRALAELQTTIVGAGVRAFDGWLDRFVIYTLVTRLSGLAQPEAATPISVHALAASLGRPYETMRRQVNALVAAGLVERREGRILTRRDPLRSGTIAALVGTTHDAFVRFVEHLALAREALPVARAGLYDPATGVQVAADIMLAVAQTNRDKHDGWLDLVLFSTVVAGNCRATAPGSQPIPAVRPVGAAAVARTIGIGHATVSRHLAAMAQTGQLARRREGYVVNRAWLDDPAAQAVTQLSLHNVRRLLGAIAARGFPFDDPASAYLGERPPLTPIG
jgi:DNA-binding transcriptional ArsR family regulator